MNNIPFLVRGDEYLSRYKNFKLVGRDEKLKELSSILMRSHANSVLLVGPSGVGCSALCVGLQASKGLNDSDTNAPFDIVSKRLFWLDTDELFSSGNAQVINASFQTMMDTLYRTPDSVLIIEETKDFLEAARNNGSMYFVNALILAVKKDKTQIIIQCREEDLETILKCRSDIHECFTLLDLQEPIGKDLLDIVTNAGVDLANYHDIRILPEAIGAAIEMTNKYRNHDIGLAAAQPQRSITLIDRALATYRFDEHEKPSRISELEKKESKTGDDIAKIKSWNDHQNALKKAYQDLREGEVELIKIEQAIAGLGAAEEAKRLKPQDDTDREKEAYSRIKAFTRAADAGGYVSDEMRELKTRLKQYQTAVESHKKDFDQRTAEINASLQLTRTHILAEFSRLSGIDVDKLNENEKAKLVRLEDDLKRYIFGQDYIMHQVANGIKVLRLGRRTPLPTPFMFMGPSGVGKTEAAKALARCLYDDEKALTRFDMSEYMEKHAVARMIGAPPGYEGYEQGGLLTNLARKNPKRVYLFDEIEKAHPDVFNVLLQVLSDGRLTDGRGLTAQFEGSIIIMTTNIGQKPFLELDNFKEAKDMAFAELQATYRPEFLNRFNGRENIYCFNRLELDSIQKIVRRELNDIDKFATEEKEIHLVMDDANVIAFSTARYDKTIGARGLPGIIKKDLESKIIDMSLQDQKGIMVVTFDKITDRFVTTLQTQPPKVALAS